MPNFLSTADMLAANVRDLMGRASDPAGTLTNAICEMELAVAEGEREIATAKERRAALATEMARHQGSREQWRERVYKALECDDLTLAVVAMSRKAEHDQIIAAIEAEQTAINDAIAVYERRCAGLRAKLAEAGRIRAPMGSPS